MSDAGLPSRIQTVFESRSFTPTNAHQNEPGSTDGCSKKRTQAKKARKIVQQKTHASLCRYSRALGNSPTLSKTPTCALALLQDRVRTPECDTECRSERTYIHAYIHTKHARMHTYPRMPQRTGIPVVSWRSMRPGKPWPSHINAHAQTPHNISPGGGASSRHFDTARAERSETEWTLDTAAVWTRDNAAV